ncbi:MAG: rod shape-determining protein MreD [Rhodobacterales bacterium]|nr:MAG: rod shape-determining protein MreD [Rhodobacterales bacterium]
MNDLSATRLWLMRIGFALLAMTILFFQLLPLDTTPARFAGPDLLMGFAYAWVLRRPEYVPVLLVATLVLLGDFFLGRPPGLWSALMLIGFESLRGREPTLRNMPFSVEWATVATVVVGVFLAYRLVLTMMLIDLPGTGLWLMQMVLTVLTYPLWVALSRFVFGLRKATLGEVNALGERQ